MLENIKSLYFIQKFFSHIEEGKKLKIVKFNKRLQNNIDINLINYKTFAKKYIIYEKNGKRKEFNFLNGNLIYEGGFLKGKRNGKGKEYNEHGILIFEGEYLNGKRNGNGIEYDYRDNIIYKGKYLNDKKWTGKGYDYKNKIIYELKDGKGYFKEFNNRIIFEGEYLDGDRNGNGKEYDYQCNLK